MRTILLRFAAPTILGVLLLAYFGVPFLDKLLADWFRNDVLARATLIANSMSTTTTDLIERDDLAGLRTYLAKLTSDERLLGVVLCRPDGTLILKTQGTPDAVNCALGRRVAEHGSTSLNLRSGSVQISSFTFSTAEDVTFQALIAQDLSFVDRRRTTMRSYALAFVGVVTTMLALLVGFVFWLLLRRWIRLLIRDISSLRFLDDAHSGPTAWPLLKQVRKVLREIERNQRLEIDFRENWTPVALQQVVRDYLHSPELFVVSNREPYIHVSTPNGPLAHLPASGMVTALEPIVRACSGTWVAHGSGSADREVVDKFDRIRVPPDNPTYTLRRVWLSEEEEQGYYYGFSNEGLWPLCHLAYVRPAFRESDWRQYQAVNEKFAEAVIQESKSREPVILVQDFHFALLPRLLRDKKPRATIVLFWHIPWPNAETFGVCPWKQEVLEHMLAADILGFHTRYHCQNFLATVDRYIECHIDREHMTVTLRGHVCRVAPYPISIEWPPRWLATLPDIATSREAVCRRHGIASHVQIGLGIERWDFTKGIVERFLALETLLRKEPNLIGHVTLLQVAAPSRSKLPAYQALQELTMKEAERINREFAKDDWQPLVLIGQHQEPREVFELLRACDFCIVNSLHDGMNLVAKEFVASREDQDGVLILSTFTGASRELPEALLINPFDVAETAEAIHTAIHMPRRERRERMKLMRRTVKENNVYRWAGRMLMDTAKFRQRQLIASMR